MAELRSLQNKIELGLLHPVAGFKTMGLAAGLRKSGRSDFSIVYSETDCAAAGVFTTNQVKAAPVLLDMERLQHNASTIRAIVTNAAVANACTGEQGLRNAHQTAAMAAAALDIEPEQVLVLSTGVIGVQLPMDKIEAGVKLVSETLHPEGWGQTANAMMTTDTRPKAYSFQSPHGYTITGVAKGSGMIAPNMATMLAVIATDAAIPQADLQKALTEANLHSFNRITVDGDTSTNDTVLLLANGAAGVTPPMSEFGAALTEVCQELARMIVLDGEGATTFIEINVNGAKSHEDAHRVANTIGTSSLVKTAFYGADANWGRILAAAGRAGVDLDMNSLSLWFKVRGNNEPPLQVVASGSPLDYDESAATAIFRHDEINVQLDLGLGDASATVWTCDLSHDYVSINANYRT